MEKEKCKLVRVEVFSHEDKSKLASRVNEFLEDTIESAEFINSSITYNTDTEEYVALVSFYLLDKNKFLNDTYKKVSRSLHSLELLLAKK